MPFLITSFIFRTEQGYCQINWVEATVGSSFELTFAGGTATTMSSAYTGAVCSKDYVHIKGAFQTTSSIAVERLCGDHWVTLDTAANVIETTAYTVACKWS